MDFTTNEKGARKLLKDEYMYLFQKNLANDVTSWECVHREKGQCKIRVKLTVTDQFIEQTNEHTHAPSQDCCEVAKVKAGVKYRTETTDDPSRQTFPVEFGEITGTTTVNLASLETMRRNISAS